MRRATHRRETPARVLVAAMRGRARTGVGLLAWSTVEAVPAYLSGRVVAEAVDRGFLAGHLLTGFAWLGLMALGILVGGWATRQSYLRLAALVEPLRDDLVRRSVSASLRRATEPGNGRTMETAAVARLTQHTEIVREAYASVLMSSQGFLVAAVGAILGLLSLEPVLLLLVVPPVAAGLALFLTTLGRLAGTQRDAILAEERIAEGAALLAEGMPDVVACGGEELMRGALARDIDAHARATRRLARLTALRTLAVALGGWLPLVVLLLAGPWLLRHGSSAGTLLGALTYVSFGLHPALETLVRQLGGPGLWLLVTLRRIIEATTPVAPTYRPAPLTPLPRSGVVRVRDVGFAYGSRSAAVVAGLHLMIHEGEHLAVVGPSGAGKSTFAALVAGLLRPQQGSIEIGAVPVGDLPAPVLARVRVLVPQDPYVFAGSLRENISYLAPEAGDDQVAGAVAELGLASLVARVGGLDAPVDPRALSAGDRQLVALARAFLSPARLVILDEATCHLDATAEAQVEAAFARRPGTLVVIAHRISSAMRADRVLVLDGQRAVVGRHAQLVKRSALYREMVGLWEPTTRRPVAVSAAG